MSAKFVMNLLRVFTIAFLISGFAVNARPVQALGVPQFVSIYKPLVFANVADSFSDRDIINIGGNIYVIASGQRRHVPNPETLDALGIGRDRINNRGYSDTDLNSIPQGPDIPDVVRDPSGFQTFKDWFLSNPTPPPNRNVVDSFATRDIINIGGNIYVIVNGQRRHVPNPETLDALGISRTIINNRGYSDADLSTIPQGPDIPDVVRDPSGFRAFKDWIFPDLTPIGQPTPIQTQPPQQSGNVASSFNTRDIINIGGNIYVIVDGQRRHVPNPETLDALGIGRDRINNRGYSDSELSSIPQGPDIPDVNRDYQGFMNFKNQYFPSSTPIATGTQPGTSGACPNAPANIKIGDIAVVTDYQPSWLRIRRQPGLNQEIIGEIPINKYVSIISGPRCVDGYRWWEVGYNGMDGWSAEVGPDGLYNLIPNTTQAHDQPTQIVVQPTLKPSVIETTVPIQTQQTTNADSTNQFPPDRDLPKLQGGWDPGNQQSLWDQFLDKTGITVHAISAQDLFLTNQCTWYVAGIRQDVAQWIGGTPRHAYLWDDRARLNGGTFGVYVTTKPAKGSIAVWEPGCGDADKDYGHVAYVTDWFPSTNKFKVDEVNWSVARPDDGIFVQDCMSFISLPSSAPADNPAPTPTQSQSLLQQFLNWLRNLFGK